MVYCIPLLEAAKKKAEEQKTLEQIGQEMCPGVKDPRDKAMRILLKAAGKQYLLDHADTLEFDINHIRNPNGNSRKNFRQMTEKEKQVYKIKHLIQAVPKPHIIK